jgi:hypothetical protein
MCSNYSLSIYPYVSATIHHPAQGGAPQALCSRISSSGTSLGPIVDDFTLMVDAPGPSTLAPHGSRMGTGGDRCRRYPQHPLGGPSSTSSTSVVAAVGPTASTPRGAHHQRLQLRWWTLPDLPPAPTGGSPSTSSASVVAAAGPAASTPQGVLYRRLQLQWWPLPDMPTATPRGPTIDVSNINGGCYRPCRQHP